jgi:hypothetical protein
MGRFMSESDEDESQPDESKERCLACDAAGQFRGSNRLGRAFYSCPQCSQTWEVMDSQHGRKQRSARRKGSG